MTADEISENYMQEFVSTLDRITLQEGVSRRDTARIYREIATEFRDRANQLESEADADGD